jgi:hypothetical protein
MTNISNIWKEREENNPLGSGGFGREDGENWIEKEDIDEYNRQSLKLILQALVERLEGERVEHKKNNMCYEEKCDTCAFNEGGDFGYNQALQDTIDYLKSELIKLE